jgi:hypothetical protein
VEVIPPYKIVVVRTCILKFLHSDPPVNDLHTLLLHGDGRSSCDRVVFSRRMPTQQSRHHVIDPTPTSEDIAYYDIVSSFNPTMPESNLMLWCPLRNFERDFTFNSIPSAGEPQVINSYATHTLGSTSTPKENKEFPIACGGTGRECAWKERHEGRKQE